MLLVRPAGGRQRVCSFCSILRRHFVQGHAQPTLAKQKAIRRGSAAVSRSSVGSTVGRSGYEILQALDARVLELLNSVRAVGSSAVPAQRSSLHATAATTAEAAASQTAMAAEEGGGADDGWEKQLQSFEAALRSGCTRDSADEANLDLPPDPGFTDGLLLQPPAASEPVPGTGGSSRGRLQQAGVAAPLDAQAGRKGIAKAKAELPAPPASSAAAAKAGAGKAGRRSSAGALTAPKVKDASSMGTSRISGIQPKLSKTHEPDTTLDNFSVNIPLTVRRWQLEPTAGDHEAIDSLLEPAAAAKGLQKVAALKTSAQQEVILKPRMRQELHSYVDMCIRTGWVGRAHSALSYFAYRASHTPDCRFLGSVDVKVCNRLLHGWAEKGDVKMARNTLAVMRNNSIKPDGCTFAYVLLALSNHSGGNVSAEEMSKLQADMLNDGVTIYDIVKEDLMVHERAAVLKVLHKQDPSIAFKEIHVQDFKNVLVDHLNSNPLNLNAPRNSLAGLLTPEEQARAIREQINLEISGHTVVESVARLPLAQPCGGTEDEQQSTPAIPTRVQDMRRLLDQIRAGWREALKVSFRKILSIEKKKQEEGIGVCLYPFLALLPEDAFIDLMLQEIDQMAMISDGYSPSFTELSSKLGFQVYKQCMARRRLELNLHDKVADAYGRYMEAFFGDKPVASQRKEWHNLCADTDLLALHESVWPHSYSLRVGQLMHELILNEVKIDACMFSKRKESQRIPAFYVIYRSQAKVKRLSREIKPHPLLIRLFHEAQARELHFDDTMLPMLVPPVPWTSSQNGGYLFSNVGLVRRQAAGRTSGAAFEAGDAPDSGPPDGDEQQILPLLEGINVVSSCPWRVNRPILDAVLKVFHGGGNPKIDIAVPISSCPPLPRITESMTNHEKVEANRQRLALKQKYADMHGQWCAQLYKLSIANKFADRVFWLPHNVDFRGRVYPCPPHFSHIGDDVSRSLLLFAHAKRLGEKGLDWLKIHLVNLTGLKKRCTLAERLAFADECMDDILDSARRPLDGRKWWQESEEPWQTLACCQELCRAIESGDPRNYVSSFPIHQDGSCNGLQHYASLGRDQAGAESVNVAPADKPQDVYTEVANMVEAERQKDAAAGVLIAQALKGFIKRKVIKQTVMTTVYGVTRYGARAQIHRQLVSLDDFPQEMSFEGSSYLVDKTFSCLQQMFTSTKEIQDWLTVSAYLIANECGEPVDWITPVGLRVIQPYMKEGAQRMLPNAMKQKNAFPPNFIHSLDSTHMILTALNCYREGVTFVSVHDCFWTHASDVDAMNKICREQFAAMYSQPILEDLAKYLMQRHGSKSDLLMKVLSKLPQRGTFDVSTVKSSQYFFS